MGGSQVNRRLGLIYKRQIGSAGWYGSIANLAKTAGVSEKKAREYLETQDSYTLNKRRIKKFPRRRIFSPAVDHQWQADLVQFKQTKGKKYVYQGLRYALTVIDVVSKFLWMVPLARKDGKTVANAFQSIILKGRRPSLLQSDYGSEFISKEFQKVLKDANIKWFHTHSLMKAAIAERVQRTILSRFNRYLNAGIPLKKRLSLRKLLAAVVESYNNTPHSAIGMKPSEVNTPENEKKVLAKLYPPLPIIKPRFKKGEIVRVQSSKNLFSKGYHNTFSKLLYKIVKVRYTKPPTYQLEELKSKQLVSGGFYDFEITRVRGK